MNRLVLREVENRIILSFEFRGVNLLLERDRDEVAKKTLVRMTNSLRKKAKTDKVEVRLVGRELKEETVREAFLAAEKIEIGSEIYSIAKNPIFVEKINFTPVAYVGLPLRASLVFQRGSLEDVELSWFLEGDLAERGDWIFPKKEGKYVFFVESSKFILGQLQQEILIQKLPENEFLDKRCEFDPKNCVVASFNILAQCYCETETAKKEMYPHCEENWLKKEFRNPLILREILRSNPDILLLQEVSQSVFLNLLAPALKNHESRYCEKGGRLDGLAIFISSKFQILTCDNFLISDLIRKTEIFKSFSKKYQNQLNVSLDKLPTVLQLTKLRCKKTNQDIIAANTHLFFQPQASHLRLLQIFSILKKIEEVEEVGIKLILAGDLNSTPETGVVELLKTQKIPKNHDDWITEFTWNSDEISEKAEGRDLETSLIFENIFEKESKINVTTKTSAFSGFLDYIFVRGFEVKRKSKFFESQLPNSEYGSDHLLVAAELNF